MMIAFRLSVYALRYRHEITTRISRHYTLLHLLAAILPMTLMMLPLDVYFMIYGRIV